MRKSTNLNRCCPGRGNGHELCSQAPRPRCLATDHWHNAAGRSQPQQLTNKELVREGTARQMLRRSRHDRSGVALVVRLAAATFKVAGYAKYSQESDWDNTGSA